MTSEHKNLRYFADQLSETAGELDEAIRSDGLDSHPVHQAQLVASMLRVGAILDESVSVPQPGSIFDRRTKSPMNEMLKKISEKYGAEHSFISTNGTSALNAAAVPTMVGPGEQIVVARDSHVSIGAGLVHSSALPIWLTPSFDADKGIPLPVRADDLDATLEKTPGARAVVLTLPTYHGLQGDLDAIVDVCRRRKVLLMIDEAHGPHFKFLRDLDFPAEAVGAGADIVTQSTHKVLSALNQGSLVHIRGAELAARYETFQALGFQTTSFSYLISLSVEFAVFQAAESGPAVWKHAVDHANRLRNGLAAIDGVDVLWPEAFDRGVVTAVDPTRVTINVRRTGMTGWAIEAALIKKGVACEMSSADTVLFLIGPAHSSIVDAILSEMAAILDRRTATTPRPPSNSDLPAPKVHMTPREAAFARSRARVPPLEAIGRVAAETIGAYPPGHIVIGPGEIVTKQAVALLQEIVDGGGHLKRANDDGFATIEVVDGIWIPKHVLKDPK